MGDVRVISPDGKSGSVPEEDLEKALSQGFRRETQADVKARQDEAQYGDRPLEAGALGVLRGATLGASDWAARATGLYEPEELKQLQERNQAASLVGEGASLLLPTGAAGLVAKAGKAAATTVRGTSLAAKVGRGAVTGAVEGGLYGAGHAVSESALDGDAVLNGEKLAAGALTGVLAGGALSGGAGLLAEGAKRGAARALPTLADGLEKLGLAQGRRVLTGGADSLSGKARISDDAVRLALDEGAITPFGTTRSASEKLDVLKGKARDEYNRVVSELEKRGIEGPEAGEIADKWLKQSVQHDATSIGSPLPDFFMKRAEEIQTKAGASGRLGLGQAEAIKRNLQRDAKHNLFDSKPLNDARLEVASDLRQAVEDTIARAARESADVEVQSLAGQFVPAKQRLGNLLEASKTAFKGAEQASTRRGISLSDNLMLAGALASGHPEALVAPVLNYLARTYGTSAVAAGAYKLSGVARRVATSFNKEVSAKLKDSPALFGRYQEVLAAASARGADDLLVAHGALASVDPEYRETMALAGFRDESPDELASIHQRAGHLDAVESALAAQDAQVDRAIGRFLGQQSGAAPRVKVDTRPRAERAADLKARMERLAELAARPEAAIDMLQPGQTLTEAAPATGAAAVATATRAIQFLHAQAPKNPNASVLPALQDSWRPSDTELTRFERYLEAVESPHAVLHRLRDGAIHPDSVQALQAVYPALLEDVRRRMMERLAQYEKPLQYKQKLALSVLMGQPMGSAGDAAKLRVLQDAHAAAQTARAQQRAKPMQAPDNLATLSQKVEGR